MSVYHPEDYAYARPCEYCRLIPMDGECCAAKRFERERDEVTAIAEKALADLIDAKRERDEARSRVLEVEAERQALWDAIAAHAATTYTLEIVQAPDWEQYIDDLEAPLYRAAGLLPRSQPQENK